jgi:nucleoside-diphosphate-sugar epimerase
MNINTSNKILVNGANGILGRLISTKLPPNLVVPAARRVPVNQSNFVLVTTNGTVDVHSLDGVKTIINCAGLVKGSESEIWQANVEHPFKLAEIAKAVGVRNFVQVSSFSVYGPAERIGPNTLLNPINYYGKSKLAAEEKLLHLNSPHFNVCALRLPFMFGVQNHSMMGSLFKVLLKAPLFPVAAEPVFRSMLTYADAADLLIHAAKTSPTLVKIAADPQVFSFAMFVQIMKNEGLKPARLIPLPSLATQLSRLIMPRLSERLFANNVLETDMNWATPANIKTGIVGEIAAIVSTLSGSTANNSNSFL